MNKMSDKEPGLLIVFLEDVEHLLMSWGSGVHPSNWSPAPIISCLSIINCLPSPALLLTTLQHYYAHNTRPRPGAPRLYSLSHSSHCPEFLLPAVKFHESGKMTTTSVAMLAACAAWSRLLSELEQLARRNWCKLWSEARARTFAVWR